MCEGGWGKVASVMSHSLPPHGLQPAKLLCPWGFSRQEYCSGVPGPPPEHLPDPGIEPALKEMAPHSSTLAWRIPMDRGAWQATVHGVEKSRTRLSAHARAHTHTHTHTKGGILTFISKTEKSSSTQHPLLVCSHRRGQSRKRPVNEVRAASPSPPQRPLLPELSISLPWG